MVHPEDVFLFSNNQDYAKYPNYILEFNEVVFRFISVSFFVWLIIRMKNLKSLLFHRLYNDGRLFITFIRAPPLFQITRLITETEENHE